MGRQSIFRGDCRVSTHDVAARHRVGFWQDHVSDTLIGIDCTATDIAGLDVSLSYSNFGDIALAEVIGNRHVVERSMNRIRRHQKNSVFVCFQLQGATHILQRGDCLALEPGDIFYYETSSPYVHGNTTDMHTLILDIPSDIFFMHCGDISLERPGKIGHRLGLGRLSLSVLTGIESQLRCNDSPQVRQNVGMQLLALAASIVKVPGNDGGLPRSGMYSLLRAKAFIEKNLGNSLLDSELVARSIGLSSRQLNRIFEKEGTSVSRFIWNRRLESAREDLAAPALRQMQVAEIAFRWGFASAAHFSHVYRQRYGLPPAAHRALNS